MSTPNSSSVTCLEKKIQMNRFLPPATHSESRSVRKVDGSPSREDEKRQNSLLIVIVYICVLDGCEFCEGEEG